VARWQVQAVKQRLSEVLRAAHESGPQIVTKHGSDVAVIIDICDYRALTVEVPDLKEYLLSPPIHDLQIQRDRTPAREVEFVD
jgi:prevent-host-death family protein